jgi:hypothetical protein
MEKKIDYVVSLLKSLSDAKNNTEILKIEEEIIEESKLIRELLANSENENQEFSFKEKINELEKILSILISKHKSQSQILTDFDKFLKDRKINTS